MVETLLIPPRITIDKAVWPPPRAEKRNRRLTSGGRRPHITGETNEGGARRAGSGRKSARSGTRERARALEEG